MPRTFGTGGANVMQQRVMRVGTRESRLAMAQTQLFIEACKRITKETVTYEVVPMRTEGDLRLDRPLYELDGKGMFISAFEEALLGGEIDVAVHSAKDMDATLAEGLEIAAALPRANPADVLVTLKGTALTESSVIGTGSLRRQIQMKEQFGYQSKAIRGNVDTRLDKLKRGEVDGLVLAAAGLERLGLIEKLQQEFTFEYLDVHTFLPAPAQGIIVAESRTGGSFAGLLSQVNDADTMECLLMERQFLRETGADCKQPVAAYAFRQDGELRMEAALWENGRRLSAEEIDSRREKRFQGE